MLNTLKIRKKCQGEEQIFGIINIKKMLQKQLFIQIEKDFKITKPIFLNAENWYDTSLCFADDLTSHSIGRYRINTEFSKSKTAEFWFDVESTSYDKDGNKIKLITKDLVNSRFPKLKKILIILSLPILKHFPDKNKIYVRVSGSGLHLFFFVKNISSKQWLNLTRYFIDKSKLKNTKGADKLVYGIDIDSVISVKRKIRETFSSNIDKIQLKKVDYKNYCSCFTLNEFFKLKKYPFCKTLKDAVSPKNYLSFNLPKPLLNISSDYNHKTEDSIEKRKNKIDDRKTAVIIPTNVAGMIQELAKCPAYWYMLRNKNADWYERNFLVKWMKYGLKLNEKQILDLLKNNSGWSDFDLSITANYIRKHFTDGTPETKYKAPIRKKVLERYGFCDNGCKECVYYDKFFVDKG